MHIAVNPASTVPLYQQIRDRIVEAIACGDLKPGDGLLSVRALSRAAAINPATAAKAYDALRDEGLVIAHRRRGMVIADTATASATPEYQREWADRVAVLIAEARAHGMPDDALNAAFAQALAHYQRAKK